MKNIFAIVGSPRSLGNCEIMAHKDRLKEICLDYRQSGRWMKPATGDDPRP